MTLAERVLGAEHPDTLTSVHNLAGLYFTQRDWPCAAQFWRRSTAAIAERTQRGALDTGKAATGKTKSEAEQSSWQFWVLVKVVYRLAPEGHAPDASDAREMFQTAQWAHSSEAAASLAQMAARGATGDPALAGLARERQDLVAEWQQRDGLHNAALGQAPDQRNAKAEADNQARLAAIDARIAEIDRQLVATFPEYAALASPAPLSVEDVQAQLHAGEALVLFLHTPEWEPTPEETFVWVVTKTDMRWVRRTSARRRLPKAWRRCAVASMPRCGMTRRPWLIAPSWAFPSHVEMRTETSWQKLWPSITPARTLCTRRCSARSRASSRTSSCCWFPPARSPSCLSRRW
jgi:hypothetical protein